MPRDEAYVIDLCDELLGHTALRQHRFDFLLGDANAQGARRRLPVDAFYPALSLVVEYHEKQHSVAVPFFDRKPTLSGVGRRAQRALYDARRREMIPANGIKYVVIDYAVLGHRSSGRLVRDRAKDLIALTRLLGLPSGELPKGGCIGEIHMPNAPW